MAQPKAITIDENRTNGPSPAGHSTNKLSLGCDQAIENPGIVIHNELLISGWAVSPEGISGIVVQIGDRTLNATYGLDTPWVAASKPEIAGSDRAGFELRMDTSDWQPGEPQVRVVAFDQSGAQAELVGRAKVLPYDEPLRSHDEIPAAIAAGEVVMWLDSPPILEGPCETEDRVEVRGWAYAEDGLEAVRVTIDGQALEAVYPIVRPDLLDFLGSEVAGAAGFVLSLHPSECPPGRHRLTVVAVGRNGRSVGVEGDVVVPPRSSPAAPRPGEPAAVEWIEDRDPPRRLPEAPERGAVGDRDIVREIERQLFYHWASLLARDRVVLDAGCENNLGAALFAAAGAERVVAVDSDEDALAETRTGTEDTPLELHRCDLCLLPFEDASFGLIACFDGLAHGEDPDLVLEELHRVLSAEGVLVASLDDGSDELASVLDQRFAHTRLSGDLDEASRVVVLASDKPLPELAEPAALRLPKAIRRLHHSAQTWEDRALHAEAVAAATRVQLNLARMHQEVSARSLQVGEAELADLESECEQLEAQEAQLLEQRAQSEGQIKSANKRLEEQEARLLEQEARLLEQQTRLEEQDERLWAQYNQLEQQRQQLEQENEQREQLGQQREQLEQRREQLEQQLKQRREQLEQHEALIDSQAATLGARNAELRVATERLRHAEAEAAAWKTSLSVRVTRPLRAIGRAARRIRRVFSRRAHLDASG